LGGAASVVLSERTRSGSKQTVATPGGASYRFEVDPFRKDCLYRGLDSIGLTLQHDAAIAAYEAKRKVETPWLFTDVRP